MPVKFSLSKVHADTVANIERILLRGGLTMVAKAKETLIANNHYVTGRLSKSITTNVENLTLEFGSNVEYANDIETGISSSTPNVNDIREWAKKKVSLGHAQKGLIGAAQSIVNKIEATGTITHWTPFMKPAFESVLIPMEKEIAQAIIQKEG